MILPTFFQFGALYVCVTLAASAITARLMVRRLGLASTPSISILSTLCGWMVLLILPLQLLAALQLLGMIRFVSLRSIAGSEILVLVLTTLFCRFSRNERRNEAWKIHTSSAPMFLKAAGGVVAVGYAIFAATLLTSYPSGFDALSYHLPVALGWLQHGSLAMPASRAFPLSQPGNAEIVMMLLLGCGTEKMVPLVNWVAVTILAISVYALAKRITQGDGVAAACSVLLVLSIPMVEFQAFSGYVDLFGTAFVLCASVVLLHAVDSGADAEGGGSAGFLRARVAVAAVACGISIGTKPVFLFYGAVFFVIALARLRKTGKPLLGWSLLLAVGMLLPAAFWFGRAVQATGNPLYPVRVAIAQHVLLPGHQVSEMALDAERKFVHSRAGWAIYPWTEWLSTPGEFEEYYGEGSGFGGAFAAFFLPGLVFAAYGCFRDRTDLALRVGLAVWAFSLVAWFTMMHRTLRYGLPVWILSAILCAPLFGFFHRNRSCLFRWLLLLSLALTCAVSALVPLRTLMGQLVRRQIPDRATFYAYPDVIDRLPSGSRVFNDTGLAEKNFALVGSHLTNAVITSWEAPPVISNQFLSSNHVDYVVRAVNIREGSEALRLPSDIEASEVSTTTNARRIWRVWKVRGDAGIDN